MPQASLITLYHNTEVNGPSPCARCRRCKNQNQKQKVTSCTAAEEYCTVCQSIATFLKTHLSQSYVTHQTQYTTYYNQQKQLLSKLINEQNRLKSFIQRTKNGIIQYKTRLNLKSNVLASYPQKIETLLQDLTSNVSRNRDSQQNTVTIGLPYLPFFNMPINLYIIAVGILVVGLIMLLLIYAFTDLLGEQASP
jgi:hypothetical protein